MQACLAGFSPYLGSWLAAAGLVGLLAMGLDKTRAIHKGSRIPEASLLALSFAGGFWGVVLGGLAFHHKTSKAGFMAVVLASCVVWLLVLVETGVARC